MRFHTPVCHPITLPRTKQAQAARSYREKGKVKQKVVHLGEHQTAEVALNAWPQEVQGLKRTRPRRAEMLQKKLDRLQELTEGAD